jgi:cysteinyl-tRNA synthetase
LTRQVRAFEPLEPGKVRLYVCGPTVYAPAHVGHAMSSIVFDVIRRWLEYRGFEVLHVMNYTDVEDKIIQRARELGVEPMALAEGHLQEYERHLRELNVLPPKVEPRASHEMDTILRMVQGLIERGAAYAVDGDIYFRVAADPDYGRLSGRKLADMRAGARVEVDERKADPADFALWKAAKPGEPQWPSPWGPGRPGWHIECSAMNLRYLGEQIDIHGGGNDLIFPHHENEIAQSETFTDKPFARYWVHNGMMQFGAEKMSKSLGNVVTVAEFLQENEPDVLRMLILNSGYRKPLTFTPEVVDQARASLERLRSAVRPRPAGAGAGGDGLEARVRAAVRSFEEAMDDDFNSPAALATLFGLAREVNSARDAGASEASLASAVGTLSRLAGILGLRLDWAKGAGNESEAGPLIDLLVRIREELREIQQWGLADKIRQELEANGILLEDGKGRTTWRKR